MTRRVWGAGPPAAPLTSGVPLIRSSEPIRCRPVAVRTSSATSTVTSTVSVGAAEPSAGAAPATLSPRHTGRGAGARRPQAARAAAGDDRPGAGSGGDGQHGRGDGRPGRVTTGDGD